MSIYANGIKSVPFQSYLPILPRMVLRTEVVPQVWIQIENRGNSPVDIKIVPLSLEDKITLRLSI